MGRIFKTRILAAVMAVLVAVTSMTMMPQDVQAAGKKVTQITMSAKARTMYIGDKYTLKVKNVKPKKASKAVSYRSSNTKVASVDKKGRIVAKKKGTATITVTSKSDKKIKARCKITVKQQVKKITVKNVKKNKLSLKKGKTFTLKCTVSPSSASSKKLTYATSNKKVATVDKKGKIKAVKEGTAKITVRSADKKAKTTITVTVPKTAKKTVKVTKVTVTPAKKTLTAGDTTTLKAGVSPSNATNKKVTWSSSNKSVATVSSTGKVKAVKAGTAKITATAADGSKKQASCTITVKAKAVTPDPSPEDPDPVPEGYKLVWEDDFNGTSLNTNDWNYEYHEPGWVNNELQSYGDNSNNVYVENGELVIQALKDSEGNYTSGRINTQGKHDFKYGRFEARMKAPQGKGFLPAFWMMPTNESLYGQWPKCGEIDIMEVLGSQIDTAYGTLHYGEPHTQSQGHYTLASGDFSNEYHTYACEWEPDEIRFYVDNQLYYKTSQWFSKKSGYGEVTYPAPYDQPFYMIFNLAVGGTWPGNPDSSTTFDEKAQLRVDYVKVYQKDSYDENVERPVENLTFRDPDADGNYIVNGDFNTAENLPDGTNWKFMLAGDGDADAEIANKTMTIHTKNAGELDYSVQLVQPGLPMIQGAKYELSFDACAAGDRTMIVDISAPDKGYKRYLADTTVDLTTDKQRYTYIFDMTDSGDVNGRLEFNLGNQPSTADVNISNVVLKRIGDADVVEEVKSVLPDGNYVYNGEFQQGKTRMDYWEFTSTCKGAAAGVTNEANVRELKVSVPSTVTASDQVLVKQDSIALTGNKKYLLMFDAYADGAKDIHAQVAGESFDAALTTEKQTFKYSFTTGADVNGTVLEFLFGTAGTVYLDNVRIQEDALLINGDFSNGMSGFELFADGSASATAAVDELNGENKVAAIDISNTGKQDWMIQLKQNNIKLENGKWYRISMDAKSTIDRTIMYALQRDGSADDDWTPYSGTKKIDLTGEYQHFSTEFQMKGETDPKTILSISMGAVNDKIITQKHTVRIDNIVLEEIDAPPAAEVPAGENLLTNGDFAEEGTDWEAYIAAEAADAAVSYAENQASFVIGNVGTEDYHVQLKHSAMTIENGAAYIVKFTICSSEARTVKYSLLDAPAGYQWYGGEDLSLEAGVPYQVEKEIAVTDLPTSDSVQFMVSMGKIAEEDTPASTITISDVSIVKK